MKTTWHLLVGLGLLINCFTALANPLNDWSWLNPLPNGNPQAGPFAFYGVVFTNGEFIAVGASGMAAISTNGINWNDSTTATTNQLNAIAYGNGQFIAVGNNGTVETSVNGTNWTLQNSGIINSLNDVACGNGRYVAVGVNGVIMSLNGAAWSPATSGISGAAHVTGNNAGFVAVDGQTSLAYYSSDGLTWTSQTLTPPTTPYFSEGPYNSIVTCAFGEFLIGSFYYSTGMSVDCVFYASSNGQSWVTNNYFSVGTGDGGFAYYFFMTGNGNVIAGGQANNDPFLQYSPNGVNWYQTNSVPTAGTALQGAESAGAYGNGSYVILTSTAVLQPTPPIFVSTDGLNWTNYNQPPSPPSGPTSTLSSITFSNGLYVVASSATIDCLSNGFPLAVESNSPTVSAVAIINSSFFGVGPNGTVYQSGDGLSWTQRNSGTTSNLHAISGGNGLIVAVGDNGAIQTSSTGTIWTSRTSGTSLALYGITYSNGLFVAVGQEGTVLSSPDGINWAGQYSPELANLFSVTYGSAGFLAVGASGTIVTSLDGTNWVAQNSQQTNTLESAAFGNGYYLVVGANSTAITSRDGVNWIPVNLGLAGGQSLYGAAFLNGAFDVAGSGGTLMQSATVTPLFDLQIHGTPTQNNFSLFVPAGTSFRLQTCTNLNDPVWTDAVSFTNAPAIDWWTNNNPGNSQAYFRLISP